MNSIMSSTFFCFLFLIFSVSLHESRAQNNISCIKSIYQFGDSLSDTGNLIRVPIVGPIFPAARRPYGKTFPGQPTGRWGDGRLILDYIANASGLPLVNPYLQSGVSFDNGINFAVAASTVLNSSFFLSRGIITLAPIASPLNVQLKWLQTYLNSSCATPECASRLRNSLVIVGHTGANDMLFALVQGRSIEEVRTFVPLIVQETINAIRKLIREGATQIVVSGNIPVGCFPLSLTLFPSLNLTAYDEIGCLRNLNELAINQNNNLQEALNSLTPEFPNVLIVYSDYYAALLTVIRSRERFDRRLRACCGIGGRYNFNPLLLCGSPGVPVCSNPDEYANWDGVHFTQETYRQASNILIPEILSKIRCTST